MKIILSVILIVVFTYCNGQQAGVRITSSIVAIYNNSNNNTSILLGDTTIKVDTFTLKAQEVWHSPPYNNDPIVKIQTGSHVVTYKLKRGNSFMIFWDSRRKYWDLKKIKNRQ